MGEKARRSGSRVAYSLALHYGKAAWTYNLTLFGTVYRLFSLAISPFFHCTTLCVGPVLVSLRSTSVRVPVLLLWDVLISFLRMGVELDFGPHNRHHYQAPHRADMPRETVESTFERVKFGY